ncbi:MAG TPA: hypothetical protein VGL53_27755 [Bryobacteraceae bacterium]|jgi:hypothetical protein
MNESVAQVDDYVALYRQAFERFGAMALWNKRLLDAPTSGDALATARSLRIEGNLDARRLAERIEQACGSAMGAPFRIINPRSGSWATATD